MQITTRAELGRRMIRLGGRCGWWVDERLLKPGSACISGGAGNDISFEQCLAEEYEIDVVLFDPSPTGMKTCAGLGANSRLVHRPLGIAGKRCQLEFAAPIDGESYQPTSVCDGRAKTILMCERLSNIVKSLEPREFCLLKLDIEGCEYGALVDLIRQRPKTFPQIAVEFHHCLPGMNRWVQRFKSLSLIILLLSVGYRLVKKTGGDFTFCRIPD